MKLCVDLFSGLGGFSQAFKEGWEVITIDLEKKFKPTVIADVNHLPLKKELKPDVLLMSPPCERFSFAFQVFPYKGIGQALKTVGAALEAVIYLKPKYWLLENPKARLRWFIGKPMNTVKLGAFGYNSVKPTDLWGNIPFGLISDLKPKGTHGWSNWHKLVGFNSKEIAKMPYGLSKLVKAAVE